MITINQIFLFLFFTTPSWIIIFFTVIGNITLTGDYNDSQTFKVKAIKLFAVLYCFVQIALISYFILIIR
jgi:hypothetical protein